MICDRQWHTLLPQYICYYFMLCNNNQWNLIQKQKTSMLFISWVNKYFNDSNLRWPTYPQDSLFQLGFVCSSESPKSPKVQVQLYPINLSIKKRSDLLSNKWLGHYFFPSYYLNLIFQSSCSNSLKNLCGLLFNRLISCKWVASLFRIPECF